MKPITMEDIQAAYDAMMAAPRKEPVRIVSYQNYKRAQEAAAAGENHRVVYMVAMGHPLDKAKELYGDKP